MILSRKFNFMKKIFLAFALFSMIMTISCTSDKPAKYQKEQSKLQLKAIDTMTKALVQTISGKAGEIREWKRFKNLFLPEATLTGITYIGNHSGAVTLTIDEYINLADRKFAETSFYEMELNKTIEVFGNIAQVFQVFISSESKGNKAGKRGINSIHLVFDKGRWWIANIVWDYETPRNRIPSKYLGNEHREILPS